MPESFDSASAEQGSQSSALISKTPLPVMVLRVFAILGIPVALFCVYFAAVHALILMGEYSDYSADDSEVVKPSKWLEMAAPMAGWIPDYYEAQGQYYLNQASTLKGQAVVQALSTSAEYWEQAYELRPGWPYYPLSALVAVSYYNAPVEQVHKYVDQLIALSYNERGVHQNLFKAGFRVWPRLTAEQRKWFIKQAAMPYGQTTRRAFQAAREYGYRDMLCANLPLNRAAPYCMKKRKK